MPSYLKYRESLIKALDASDDDITWITVKGNHIPIKKGQNKGEAVKEFFAKKNGGSAKSSSEGKSVAKKVSETRGRNKLDAETKEEIRLYANTISNSSTKKSMFTVGSILGLKGNTEKMEDFRDEYAGEDGTGMKQINRLKSDVKKIKNGEMKDKFGICKKYSPDEVIDILDYIQERYGKRDKDLDYIKKDSGSKSEGGKKESQPAAKEEPKKEFMSKAEYSKVLKNVQPILKKASDREPQITKDLKSIEGIKLVGLEYRKKAEKSAVEKVKRERIEKGDKLKGVSDKKIMDNMWDLVRYTQEVDKDSFVKQARKTLDFLQSKGYKIHQLKNFWRPEVNEGTNPYRGINVKIVSPTGQKMEFQFNTANNMKVKEKMHQIYNKQRELDPKSKEYQALNKESLKLTKLFDNPKGIQTLVIKP